MQCRYLCSISGRHNNSMHPFGETRSSRGECQASQFGRIFASTGILLTLLCIFCTAVFLFCVASSSCSINTMQQQQWSNGCVGDEKASVGGEEGDTPAALYCAAAAQGGRLGPGDRGSCLGSRPMRGHWLTIDGVLGILCRSWFSEFCFSEGCGIHAVWIWMISSGEWI